MVRDELLFLLHNDRLSESGKKNLEDYIIGLEQRVEALQQENENLKCIISSVKEDYLTEHNELEDYKSRCEKINEILKEFPDFNYSNDYVILKRKIEEASQGCNDNK